MLFVGDTLGCREFLPRTVEFLRLLHPSRDPREHHLSVTVVDVQIQKERLCGVYALAFVYLIAAEGIRPENLSMARFDEGMLWRWFVEGVSEGALRRPPCPMSQLRAPLVLPRSGSCPSPTSTRHPRWWPLPTTSRHHLVAICCPLSRHSLFHGRSRRLYPRAATRERARAKARTGPFVPAPLRPQHRSPHQQHAIPAMRPRARTRAKAGPSGRIWKVTTSMTCTWPRGHRSSTRVMSLRS